MRKKNDLLRNKSTFSGYLRKNYQLFIITVGVLILIPYLILAVLSQVFQGAIVSNQYTAETLMKDNVEEISTEQVVKYHGSVDVINKELQVTHLGGEDSIKQAKFTAKEFTLFLMDTGNHQKDYQRSIQYNENEQFWLIVTFPVSLRFEIIFQYNQYSTNFNFFFLMFLATILGYVVIVSIISIFFAKHTAKTMIKPIRKLEQFAKRIEEDCMMVEQEPVSEYPIREFGSLANTLNHMAKELKEQSQKREAAENNRKQLVRDIAHDLKNPLASIQGYSELYLNHPDKSIQQQKEYVEIINRNSIRANELIVSLFEYSKLDSQDYQLKKSRIDFAEFLRIQIADFLPICEEQNLTVEAQIPEEELLMEIDEKQMSRAVHNLFDNILKYHTVATCIFITLQQENSMVKLKIGDNGIGMDELIRTSCFEPFTRGDQVRNSKSGGSGLGLAIVKRIVEAHAGTIAVESKKGYGCMFSIQLPF